MVVIELDDETDVNNPPKSRPDSSSSSSSTLPNANTNRDASDGFETASDGELVSDDEDGNGGGGGASNSLNEHEEEQQQQQQHHHHQPQQQQQQAEEEEPIVALQGDSSEDALNDDELEQKALAQANDSKLEGNKLFGDGQYEEALSQYELALQVAPEMPSSVEIRSICHANRGICFQKLGKYEDTIKECTKALELNPTYMKALIRRGEAHEKLEHYEESIADLKKILELDPSNDQAKRSIRRLEPLAEQKREKLKEEMIGKLKDMGDSLLGRFGMSVDNFKAVKDPNTGSYSISFQR